ncbi:unnamed protein product [Rotaria magnacalcarata]|uniref:Uncharacterized protein n=1 Tax=Rotaria magnacalcarata TaxID=392030 RepID=A0A820ASZ4_9BILA|nr:unnamed protein product [Rotaria magnacalcarata]
MWKYDLSFDIFPFDQIQDYRHVEQRIQSTVHTTALILPAINQFGQIIYADNTVSGRGLLFIEQYMLKHVLPYYANIHSEDSAGAIQTTKFHGGSRALIKRYANATDDDVAIFIGSESRAAMNKMINVLNLKDEQVRSLIIAKKKFFQNQVLVESPDGIATPDVLGAIRVGSVFHLKESVGCHIMEALENECVEKFFRKFRNHEKLIILGSTSIHRLALFSFLIYVPIFMKYLHHNFVSVLLNDLFGIRVRSECSYNASYVSGLLNLDDQRSEIIMKFLTANENDQLDAITKNELIRYDFTQLDLSYFTSDEDVDYIFNAIEFIANGGWQFLPLYTCDSTTAVWRARTIPLENPSTQLHSLQMITFENGTMEET